MNKKNIVWLLLRIKNEIKNPQLRLSKKIIDTVVNLFKNKKRNSKYLYGIYDLNIRK
jgi:hypothetical protein